MRIRKPFPEADGANSRDEPLPLPSIWDVAETEDPQEGSREDPHEDPYDDTSPAGQDPFAPPIPMAARRPGWLDPRAWVAAERGAGRALAEAAEAVGRLDERLRRAPEPTRLAWRERLALEDISALLWAEGVRLRPETLALADAGRLGRTEDEDWVIARAQWAQRRLAGQGEVPRNARAVPAFLGRTSRTDDVLPGGVLQNDVLPGDPGWGDLPEALIPPGPDDRLAASWCAAMAALADAHPLTRSAAAFHLWRGQGLSAPEMWLEPGVIAARVAASGTRGGLASVPLLAGSDRALVQPGGDAAEKLGRWLAGLARAAGQAQMALDRIEAWHAAARGRAERFKGGLKGKGAPALIDLLSARPIASARDVATALEISRVQARTLLNRFEALGLVRELTGQGRFRYWTAAQ